MKPILSYNESTETIRQLPENYLVASKEDGVWSTRHIDLAVDKELATRVFLELLNFESKYLLTGLELLAKVTPNDEFKNKDTYVVLIPVRGSISCPRSACESIEAMKFNVSPYTTSHKVLRSILFELGLESADIEIEHISDFMDRCNNQEFYVDDYFISYVYA